MPADLADFSYTKITQGYLSRDPVIRIRKTVDANRTRFLLTVKGKGLSVHEEYELNLTEAQYEGLLSKTVGRLIEKKRYRLPLGDGHVAELDLFEGANQGLVLIEVEFESQEDMEAFTPPAWFGTDVTDDRRYYNSELSA
jgi:CYTH domain-containing protein